MQPAADGRSAPPGLGFWSGVGLVIANMVGVGVLTSTGYMAADLHPGPILLAWATGGLAAMAGARSYAALAAAIPRSGGEYRFLTDLLHPAVGYLAGWTSLLVGFSAPIAVAAATAGPFATTLFPNFPPTLVGGAMIVLVTFSHALDLTWSKATQDLLAAVKVVLLVGFVAVGLFAGNHAWPHWPTPEGPLRVDKFMVSLVYIAYAYTGWNTVVYAAEEFREPRRTVPRAMLFGTAVVTVLYLAVNAVFVFNLAPSTLAGWTAGDTQHVTVAHLVVEQIAGPFAAKLMSVFVILALFSSVSSMTMVGPRVYAAMAREGVLPRALAGEQGRPPMISVLLQSAISLGLLFTHTFEQLLHNVGAILTLTAALTTLCLFRLQFSDGKWPKPGPVALSAATIFVALSAWMLYFAFRGSPRTIAWVLAVAACAIVAWFATARGKRALE